MIGSDNQFNLQSSIQLLVVRSVRPPPLAPGIALRPATLVQHGAFKADLMPEQFAERGAVERAAPAHAGHLAGERGTDDRLGQRAFHLEFTAEHSSRYLGGPPHSHRPADEPAAPRERADPEAAHLQSVPGRAAAGVGEHQGGIGPPVGETSH